jgi:alpha-tubulin suppressor-like RCC1 family protein
MRHCSHALSSESEESKVSATAGIRRRLHASVKMMGGAVRALPGVAAIGCRKLVAITIAVLMTIAPVTSDAATFQYFRMYGGGQGGTVVSPPPTGSLSYSVAGPSTATVGVPYSASASVAGAVGAAVFSVFSGSFPPGLSLNGASGAISGTPSTAGSYSSFLAVTDSTGAQGFAPFALSVSPGLSVAGSPSTVGTVGQGYAAQFSAAGGSAPYTFSTSSSLPPGLTLSASGLLAGTPITVGTFRIIAIQAQDAAGSTASAPTFSIEVADPLVVSWSPASGQVGLPYVPADPSVSGGRSPFLFSLNGQAPDGMVFDNSSGDLNGTPLADGTFRVGVTAIDADGRSAQSGLQNLVIAPGSVQPQQDGLALASLPSTVGQLGVGYLSHVTATGGTQPYTFSSVGAALPPGLSLAAHGTLSGTPTALGTFSGIRISVADAAGGLAQSDPLTITISVPPALVIAGNPSSSAQVGVSYEADFTAFDGTGTGYTFSLAAGSLPPGLRLSSVGGTQASIVGTANMVGTFSGLQIQVIDSSGQTALSSVFSITVTAPSGPALVIAGSPQSFADVGTSYSATLTASGGTGTGYVFSIANGSLPSGLTLSPAGVIAGMPSATGPASFTVRVMDSAGDTAQATYSIAVSPAIGLGAIGFPSAVWGVPYSLALQNSGGVLPYHFTQSGLPAGLSLDPTTGIVSGTPQGSGFQTFTVTVTVSDSAGSTATESGSLIVTSPIVVSMNFPSGVVGETYDSAPTVTGGTGSFKYFFSTFPGFISFDPLTPFGLALDPSTGAITGTPTASGTTDAFVLQVEDHITGLSAAPLNGTGGVDDTIIIHPALAIADSPATTATVGIPYAASFTFSGGNGSATFALASGTLPAWLSLDPASGTLSGTPSFTDAGGTFGPFAVEVSDGVVSAVAAPFSITVASGAPSASATLTSSNPVRSGGVIAGTLATSLAAPVWGFSSLLNLTASGNNFSGIAPPVVSSTTFLVTAVATQGANSINATSFSVTVIPALAIASSPSGTLNGEVGVPFASTAPMVSGAVGTVSYTLLQGSTPFAIGTACPGLSFSSGVISGQPSPTCSVANLAIQASDAGDGATATSPTFAVNVSNSLSTPTGSFTASVIAGSAYSSGPLTETGGVAPYTWSLASSSLPTGLSLSSLTGILSGIPITAGTFTFAVKVTDAVGAVSSASANQTVTVTAATASLTLSTPTTVRSGDAISGTLSTNLTTPTWSFVNTPTPAGQPALTLTPSGTSFSGTAPAVTTPTAYAIAGMATASGISRTAGAVTENVKPPVTVSAAPSNIIGAPGSAITSSAALTAGNIIGSATFSLLRNGTPLAISSQCGGGLSLNSSTGVISGIPAATCTLTNLSIKATDSYVSATPSFDTAATAAFSITISTPTSNVFAWGSDTSGQLGDGGSTNQSTKVAVLGGKTFTQVSAGASHSCGVVNDGTVQCWGDNSTGELGKGTTATASVAPVTVPGLSGVTQVSAGNTYTCAVAGGGVFCWGANDHGQLGDGTTTQRLSPVAVSGLSSGVAAISASVAVGTTCALLSNGTVKCWGVNSSGQLGDGTATERHSPVVVSGLSGVTQISVGPFGACALSGGAAKCWGAGSVIGVGNNNSITTPVTIIAAGVTAVSEGDEDGCAIVSGAVKCWGDNFDGEVGDGTAMARTTPVAVSGLSSGATQLSVGNGFTCAIVNGIGKCWGNNGSGQLGNGSATQSNVPVTVTGGTGFTQISAGGSHALAR